MSDTPPGDARDSANAAEMTFAGPRHGMTGRDAMVNRKFKRGGLESSGSHTRAPGVKTQNALISNEDIRIRDRVLRDVSSMLTRTLQKCTIRAMATILKATQITIFTFGHWISVPLPSKGVVSGPYLSSSSVAEVAPRGSEAYVNNAFIFPVFRHICVCCQELDIF